MRTLFILILCFFTTYSFAATEKPVPKAVSVKLDFNYQIRNQKKLVNKNTVQNLMTMPAASHEWRVISQLQSQVNADVFLLLGKIEKAETDAVTLRFLVVDLNRQDNFISEPEMIVNYGKKAQIKISEGKHKLQLTVMANKESS
jgi:hypothetical protein